MRINLLFIGGVNEFIFVYGFDYLMIVVVVVVYLYVECMYWWLGMGCVVINSYDLGGNEMLCLII